MTMQAEQPLKIILVDETEDDLEVLALAMQNLADTSGLDVSTEILGFADPAEAVAKLPAAGPAAIASQCALRNVLQGIRFERSGAGSIPRSLRIRRTGDRETAWPSLPSSPTIRV